VKLRAFSFYTSVPPSDWHKSAVPENLIAQKIIRRCFPTEDLDWLYQQPNFREGLAALQTLADVERLAEIGQQMLLARPATQ